jgi:hypothetical protein
MGILTRVTQRTVLAHVSIGLVVFLLGLGAIPVQAEESSEPKSIRKTCGKCPEGYAMTGVTEFKEICKDGDPTLVQCVPLGANLLSVCGVCPEGYREIGSSSVPARCGNQDGGRMTQCQLDKMELNLPDPTQGGKICPPDCGSTATPGQGALPPPPKYLLTPEKK